MPRLRNRKQAETLELKDVWLELLIGPCEYSGPQLEAAWKIHADEVMASYSGRLGSRPWAYWVFELGERPPLDRGDETARLAELGQLNDHELAALAEKANEARIRLGTGRELISDGTSVDARTVETYDRVRKARR